MKTDNRYKIDVFLQMARITTNEDKKQEYLESVEFLLSDENSNEKVDFVFDNPTAEFIRNIELEKHINQPTKCLYNIYTEWCKENQINPETKTYFSRTMMKIHNVRTKPANNGASFRVWVKANGA